MRAIQHHATIQMIRHTSRWATRVVHEHELGMAAFVEAVSSTKAPCCRVLRIRNETKLYFRYFYFLGFKISHGLQGTGWNIAITYAVTHSDCTPCFLVLVSDTVIRELRGILQV